MPVERCVNIYQKSKIVSFTNFQNGPIEGANNKIKVIKRTAYGFRNFNMFRLRILIAFKDSFYPQSYRQKATKFIKNSAA